jgi:hypothetical protein
MAGDLLILLRGRTSTLQRDALLARVRVAPRRSRRRSLGFIEQIQGHQDPFHNLTRLWLDRDNDWILVRSRLLKRLELAVQQISRHEMIMTGGDTACDESLVPFEINQPDVRPVPNQDIAISSFQRGTGNDAVPARSARLVDPGGNRVQPGPAILIGKRNAGVHFLDIGRRMKPVCIFEFPAKAQSEKRSDRRFPASRNAHHDHNHGGRN